MSEVELGEDLVRGHRARSSCRQDGYRRENQGGSAPNVAGEAAAAAVGAGAEVPGWMVGIGHCRLGVYGRTEARAVNRDVPESM